MDVYFATSMRKAWEYQDLYGFIERLMASEELKDREVSAAAAGASERSIMAQTGHRSITVVRRYIRGGSLF